MKSNNALMLTLVTVLLAVTSPVHAELIWDVHITPDAVAAPSPQAWIDRVVSPHLFETTAANIALANEVASPPSNNQSGLGGASATLTFSSAATLLPWGFSVAAPGSRFPSVDSFTGFTFNETSGSPIFQSNALSVGHINTHEDDDVVFEILTGPDLHGFGFDLLHSIDYVGTPETVQVFGAGEVLLGTLVIPQLSGPGNDRNLFIGVTSTTAITRIVFDEDPLGDDVAIRNFRFAGAIAVPEPSSMAFIAAAGLSCLYRRGRYTNRMTGLKPVV